MFWVYFLLIATGIHLLNQWRIKNSPNEQERINAPNINRDNLKAMVDESNVTGVMFNSFNNSGQVVLDKGNEKLHVFYSTGRNDNKIHSYKHRIIAFEDILASEVVVDSKTIVSTSRGSQIGGAVIGGALLGGVGAIVGGLSGKTISEESIRRMDIKLTVNDLEKPTCKINFLDGYDIDHYPLRKGYKTSSVEYKDATSEIEKWQGMFDIILNEQKRELAN